MKGLNLLLSLLMVLIVSSTYAQGWERIYDGGYDEFTLDASLSPDGGMVLGGTQNISADSGYSYVIRTNTEGDIMWNYTDSVGLGAFTRTDEVLAFSDGSVFLTGVSADAIPINNPITLKKLSAAGQLLWSISISRSVLSNTQDILELADGNLLLVGVTERSGELGIIKYDPDGNQIWNAQITIPGGLPNFVTSAIETSNGNLLILGYSGGFSDDQNVTLTQLSASGGQVWQKIYPRTDAQFGLDIAKTSSNEYLVAVSTTAIGTGVTGSSILKLDQNGDQIWWRDVPGFSAPSASFMELVATANGMALAGSIQVSGQQEDFQLTRLDQEANVIDSKTYGRSKQDRFFNLFHTADGGFYISGYTQRVDDSYDAYLIKTDSLGYSLTNELKGKVFFDQDADCLLPSLSTDLSNWIVKASGDNFEWLTVSDQNGNYTFDLDTGDYQITTFPVSPYWNLCQDTVDVNFSNFFESQTLDFPAQASVSCPYLDVSVSTPFLRRCFENTYYIDYCNSGTELASDAYVELTLDPEMTYINSSIPLSSQNGLVHTFEVGDVDVGICEQFWVTVQLGCDSVLLGQTHCVEAHIYPDTSCLPLPSNWSGASIRVDGICAGDSILFFIENVGSVPTQNALEYIVIEDDVILMRSDDVLEAGEIRRLAFATNGKTYRLEVEQESGHPGSSSPSVAIERCTDGSGGAVSLGYITQFSQNDGDAFIDIDCQENIGAYDPNDKTGYPKGATAERLIKQNQDIEYLIRFQNTGTDTAFNVVIKDTLSELLDPTSIQVGASSHPFTYTLTGAGVLQFRFADIMLPDSNVNEPASNGFVRFSIAQQPDLPFGTIIENDADIYFDFNAPIVTNETLHTIGELRITVNVDEVLKKGMDIKVFPNPFKDEARMTIVGLEPSQEGQMIIYNSTGQQLSQQYFRGDQLRLNRGHLPAGVYFFQVVVEGELIGSGKLLIQ